MGFVIIDDIGMSDAADYLTANSSDCVISYKAIFLNSNGEVISGTLPNSSGKSLTFDCLPSARLSRLVAKGYHNGSEILKVNPIPATNCPSNGSAILKGKTAYISNGYGNISLITGTAGR